MAQSFRGFQALPQALAKFPLPEGKCPHIHVFMNAQQTLLAEIENFLSVSGMAPGTFGHATVNDGKFVGRLRRGGSVTLETAERIRSYIATHSKSLTRGKTRRKDKCHA